MDVRDTNWASRCARGDPAVGRPDGGGESYLGLHADPRGAEERRPSRRSLDDCAHREGARPATRPQRPTSWQTFLRAHWGAIAGPDFFTTEVWTWRGLVTYYTVFVIDLASRRVQIVGSTPHPGDLFMCQVGRTVTAVEDGLLRDHRVLICDRDRKWSAEVRRPLNEAGLRVVQTPLPGAECERVCGTIRPIDQGGMSRSDDSDRRAALPAGDQGIRRSLSSRTQSSSAGQRAHRRRRSPADRTTNSPTPAARWTAQLLRTGRVTGPAELWNITPLISAFSSASRTRLSLDSRIVRATRRDVWRIFGRYLAGNP